MIERVECMGKLVHACSIAGETRADDVFPGHPNGIPLSRNRWLILYATRGRARWTMTAASSTRCGGTPTNR